MINLDEILQNAVTIGISGHVRPDGDCIGSTLAMYNYIRDRYPKAKPELFLEIVPGIFRFLQRSDEICTGYPKREPFDLFIALDCADAARVGKAAGYYEQARHTLCIDHHETNAAFAENNFIVPSASSTCELVYEVLPKEFITRGIAECLYTGIVHDTGVFRYSCTSSRTMNIAGELMDKGIDYPKIIDETFDSKSYKQNKLLGRALSRSCLYLDNKCILTYLTDADMKEFDALSKDTEGIVSQLRNTRGAEVSVFFYPAGKEGGWKFSTRATGDVNLARLAQTFGGGGHAKAAGFTLNGTIDEVTARVLDALKEAMECTCIG